MIEIIGYMGMFLILISLTIKSRKKLHVVNGAGCLIFIIYSMLIGDIPFILTNLAILITNIWGWLHV